MEYNFDTQYISARMSLEDALKAYSDEIQILTLKDGTNIEIVPSSQFLRSRPVRHERTEIGYTDNQLQNVGEKFDEFIQEDIMENSDNFNYQQMTPNKQGVFRGKGKNKGLGKSLRKTVLKSINGGEKEKVFENGKLKNLKSDKPNSTLNEIIHFSETNDFIQCANCHIFFPPDEEENKQTVKTTINDQQIPSNSLLLAKNSLPSLNSLNPIRNPSKINNKIKKVNINRDQLSQIKINNFPNNINKSKIFLKINKNIHLI